MKKFFKALALVLALALVVGVLPTAEAQAAKTHKVVTTKTLFIGGSTGTKTNGKTCGTKESVTLRYLAGYTKADAKGHTFSADVTDGKSYVKVSGSKVTALAAGLGKTATLTIKVDGKEVGTTTVKICKNATQDSLTVVTYIENDDEDTKKAQPYVVNPTNGADGLPAEFIAGVNYLFKVPQGGKDTDQRRILLNGLELAENYYEGTNTVPNKRNFLKKFAVEDAGSTANIEIQAFQSDKFNGNSTTPKKFSKPVIVKLITAAEQIAYNQFAVTFDTAEHAKQAVDSSNKYLTTGDKPVTDKEFVIELFADPDDKAARKNVYMAGFAQSAVDKKVVICTVFGELAEKAKYEVTYGDEEQYFNTVEFYPTAIRTSYTYAPTDTKKLAEGGKATLTKKCVAINEKGNDVDITDKVADYINWYYTEAPVQNPQNDGYYQVDGSDGTVYFTAADKWALVDIEFVYNNGVKTPTTLKARERAESKYAVSYTLEYWWAAPVDAARPDKSSETTQSAELYSNTTTRLFVSVKPSNGTLKKDWTDEDLTFESANEDSVSVYTNAQNEAYLEAGNKDYTRTTNIYVKYLGQRIGTIPVTIFKTPHLAKVSVVRATDGLLSQGTTPGAIAYGNFGVYVPVADHEMFYVIATDENGYYYPYTTAKLQKISNDSLDDDMIKIIPYTAGVAGAALDTLDTKDDEPMDITLSTGLGADAIGKVAKGNVKALVFSADTYAAGVNATKFGDEGVKHSVNYKITLTDDENTTVKPISAAISFSAKNVDANTTVSTVKAVKVSDVAAAGTKLTPYQYCVMGYDNQGFRVCGFYLSENIGNKNFNQSTAIDAENRMYLKFTDPNGSFRHASVATGAATAGDNTVVNAAWINVAGHGPEGLTVATFTPIEIYNRAGLPVVNSSDRGFTTGAVTALYGANAVGARYYTYDSFKVRLYKGGAELGSMQTAKFSAPTYLTLTWKWANNGAYSNASNAGDALDECILFSYKYNEYTGVNTTTERKGEDLKWSELPAAVRGVLDLSYVETESDVRFMYVYVDQYAAAIDLCKVDNTGELAADGAGVATIGLKAADAKTLAGRFVYQDLNATTKKPSDGLWTAIKIDRSTKLAD